MCASYVLDQIATLGESLGSRRDSTNPITNAHSRQAERDIARYLENPAANAPKSALAWGAVLGRGIRCRPGHRSDERCITRSGGLSGATASACGSDSSRPAG